MVSLTTVYLVSVILTSIAGFGSVFASKKFVGGSEIIEEVANEPEPVDEQLISPPQVEEPLQPSTEQTVPEVPSESEVETH